VENGWQHFFNVSLTRANPPRQIADRRLHTGAKTARGPVRRRRGLRLSTTHHTGQRLLAVLGYFRFDPRQFGHLMAHRLSVLAQQQRPAVVTLERLEINHVLHLLNGEQLPPMSGVSRLPARLAPRRRALGTRRGTRRIRRWRLRRVLGVAPELFAQLGDFGLQGRHLRRKHLERLHLLPQGDNNRLDSRWRRIPVFFRNGQLRRQRHDSTLSQPAVHRSGVYRLPRHDRLVEWHSSVIFRWYASCQGSQDTN
jgi:hypothetical protein